MGSYIDALRRMGPIAVSLEGLLRLVNSGLSWVQRKIFRVRYYERKVHNYRLLLDLHDQGISKQLMTRGDREQEHAFILREVLKPGMTVFDLGANIGYYSVMMAKLVGTDGKIYAVEPFPANYHLLNLNLRLNKMEGVVDTANIGIGGKTGKESLFVSSFSNCHSFVKEDLNAGSESATDPSTKIQVPVLTIGDFSKGKRHIDLVRMDIEGYEVEVLGGLVSTLDRGEFDARILFETHPDTYDSDGRNMRLVLKELFARGYRVKWLVADRYYKQRAWDTYREKGYPDSHIIEIFRKCDRAIYRSDSDTDAIELICGTDLVRAVLLEHSSDVRAGGLTAS